ncbi:ECF-type sigma factor [Paenibacillus typhae]|uniref:ECF sigma factor n=1 Tax=Paenibacillus typhae TaxID=1174501 RepID=A0A1G8X328_9BACL|nr:ECF-type sigma factor [Paenibacillus typhae]SDJ84747.1 ECF sigma factor [Paenibacillus typhae]
MKAYPKSRSRKGNVVKTPEQLESDRKSLENFEYLETLYINAYGQVVTPEQDAEYERQRKFEENKRIEMQDERENARAWKNMNFETLNSLIIQYKHTKQQNYFNQAWSKYLKILTWRYLQEFVIKGLPVNAKRLFLYDYESDHLEDVLYDVLLKSIENWKPNAPDKYTMDFAAYYKRAVEFFSGNIINRLNNKKHCGITIQNMDFNNEEDMSILLLQEPNLAIQLQNKSSLDTIIMNDWLDGFMKILSADQVEIVNYIGIKNYSILETSKRLKVSRMTIHRKLSEIKMMWLSYDQS